MVIILERHALKILYTSITPVVPNYALVSSQYLKRNAQLLLLQVTAKANLSLSKVLIDV